MDAFNSAALERKGLLHWRKKIQMHEKKSEATHKAIARQLPSLAQRQQATQDVDARIAHILGSDYKVTTLLEHYQYAKVSAECWMQWGKENGLDCTFHEKQFQEVVLIQKMMEPEKSTRPTPQGDQAQGPPSSNQPGLLPNPSLWRRQPLHLADMDLNHIHVTHDPNHCHWCQSEQPWGIPGGLHFKPQPSPDSHAHPSSAGEADNDHVSIMCRDCATFRYQIASHSEHGPWLDLPSRFPLPPTAHPKTSMRLSSCSVCTGLATALCAGCPLRVCINCQVSLDRFWRGSLDRLVFGYGEMAVRNDARLMTCSLLMDKTLRAVQAMEEAAETAVDGDLSFETLQLGVAGMEW